MKIVLIGCGSIGSSLLNLWIYQDIASEIAVVQPSLRHQHKFDSSKIFFTKHIKDISPSFEEDVVVLALKPQNLNEVTFDLKNRNRHAVIVSTLAGVPVKILKNAFPNHQNLIRIMPNIAIKDGNSVNLAFMAPGIGEQCIRLFHHVFDPTGEIFVLEDEQKIDLLTPIFGSGPAYFFLLADILLKETMKYGVSETDAKRMVDMLLKGSAHLVNKDQSYVDLISSICSKKGVTEVALRCIEPKMQPLIEQGLKEALNRINEIENENRSKPY